jgi:hypothetical protein
MNILKNLYNYFYDITEISYNDGSTYVGCTKDGMYNGLGVYKDVIGTNIDGLWRDHILISGTITYGGGDKYVGEFKDGAPHGVGTKYFKDGTVYNGQFEDGIPKLLFDKHQELIRIQYDFNTIRDKREKYKRLNVELTSNLSELEKQLHLCELDINTLTSENERLLKLLEK